MPADRREDNRGFLASIGVEDPAAEPVWRALMRHPNEDLEGLASRAGVTVSEARAAIDTLLEAQLLSGSSKPSGAAAIDPRLAIETHIARVERHMAERNAAISDLRTHVAEFVEDYSQGRAGDPDLPLVEIVVSLEDIRQRIYIASEATARTQRSLIRSPSSEGLKDAQPPDFDQQARGVDRRTIIGASELAETEIFEHFQGLHARGERIRALGAVPTQMLIMDESLAVLAVDPESPRKGAIFVQERGIVQLLIYLFDHLWSEADAIFNIALDQEAPSGRTARILELMAGGVKDERIARTLGIGARTVRRDIAELRDRLGVTSRTEIIAAAIRRGWL
ncbi:MAG: LuxR C-terminal-related transcriptional regulator [Mycobacteriales bacterium]